MHMKQALKLRDSYEQNIDRIPSVPSRQGLYNMVSKQAQDSLQYLHADNNPDKRSSLVNQMNQNRNYGQPYSNRPNGLSIQQPTISTHNLHQQQTNRRGNLW